MLGFDAVGKLALGQGASHPPPQGLFAPLFTNTNSFHAATVSTDYALTPALFTNTQTFYSATVAADGIDIVVPDLFTNASVFYAATVTPGGVGITAPLVDGGDTFYAITLVRANVLRPPLVSEADVFYAAVLDGGEDEPPARGGFGVVFPRMTARASFRTRSTSPVLFTRINND